MTTVWGDNPPVMGDGGYESLCLLYDPEADSLVELKDLYRSLPTDKNIYYDRGENHE